MLRPGGAEWEGLRRQARQREQRAIDEEWRRRRDGRGQARQEKGGGDVVERTFSVCERPRLMAKVLQNASAAK